MQPGEPGHEETAPASGGRQGRKGSHIGASIFHLLFKSVAILYFLMCERLFDIANFVTNFIVLLVFISADFWVVKNVTGRYLVGLRWWNDNSAEGHSWRFEHLEPDQREILQSEKVLFWGGLVGNIGIWSLLSFMTLVTPSKWEYLLPCVIALLMGGSNFYGYFKCSSEARQFVKEHATNAIISATASGVHPTTSTQP